MPGDSWSFNATCQMLAGSGYYAASQATTPLSAGQHQIELQYFHSVTGRQINAAELTVQVTAPAIETIASGIQPLCQP